MSGTYEIPTMTARRRLRLRWLTISWRVKAAWWRAVAPHKLHPEELSGYDGEPPHFLRADLAATREDVVEYFRNQFRDQWDMTREQALDGMGPVDDIERVWMVPHVPTDTDPEYEEEGRYDTIKEWRAGATEYWRWSW